MGIAVKVQTISITLTGEQYQRLLGVCPAGYTPKDVERLLVGLAMAHIGNQELVVIKQRLDAEHQQKYQIEAERIAAELKT
jgi:hypothetical protein